MARRYLFYVILLILVTVCPAEEETALDGLPPIETCVMEPIIIERINIWVPAAHSGLVINRSCRARENLSISSELPASIEHRKTQFCPAETARILAETTAFYLSRSLPLTIFNGWQWEYSYGLSQYELVSYDLPERGGCWENCWEAMMDFACGSARLRWLEVQSCEKYDIMEAPQCESTIEIKTFSSMRTRDGYPKERQL